MINDAERRWDAYTKISICVTIEDVVFAKTIPIRAAKRAVIANKKLRENFETYQASVGHSNNNIIDSPKAFYDDLKKFVNEELNYQFHELNRRIVENDYGRLCVASDVVVEIEIDD